ncbi:aldolase [Paenibacillus roseus]
MSLVSEFPIPELIVHEPGSSGGGITGQVEIRRADLQQAWGHARMWNAYTALNGEQVLFYIPNVGILGIEGGRYIWVSPFENCNEDQLRLYILGSCMGALLLQRGILPLHGSAVVLNGKAYAFCGESGAGKSTLAAVFTQRGYSMLTDDVIAISFTEQGCPVVIPSYPQQKLWQASLDRLGMYGGDYAALFDETEKFGVPVRDSFESQPVPLAGFFELQHNEGTESTGLSYMKLSGLMGMPLLFTHTYRNFLVPMLGLGQWHFDFTARLAGQLLMAQFKRGSEGFTAPVMADHILQWVMEGEAYHVG